MSTNNNNGGPDEEEVKRLMDKMLSLIGSYVSTSLSRIKSKYKPLFDHFEAGFGLETPLMDFDDDGVIFLESSYAELGRVEPSVLSQMLSGLGIRASGYPLISTVGLICLGVGYDGSPTVSIKGTAMYAVEESRPVTVEGTTLHCARRALVEAGGGIAEPVSVETKAFIDAARQSMLSGWSSRSVYVDKYKQLFGFPPMETAIGVDSFDVNTPVPAKLVPDLGDLAIAKIVGTDEFTVDEVDVGIHCTAKPVGREYMLDSDKDMLLMGSEIDDNCVKYVMLRSKGKGGE